MFLLLSKLLPALVYPAGLATVLLVAAAIVGWKRPRWSLPPLAVALGVLLLAGNGWVNHALLRSLERQHVPPGELPEAEAIVLLGGSLQPASPPRPMVGLSEAGDRVLYAARLYRDGKASPVIASGGRIGWLSGARPEATDMARLLRFMGVPATAIVTETEALNTHQNATRVRAILARRGIERVLLVTSALHMPRALGAFRQQGIEAVPAPTDFLATRAERRALNRSVAASVLALIPDAERLKTSTQALKEYLGLAVYWLRGWI